MSASAGIPAHPRRRTRLAALLPLFSLCALLLVAGCNTIAGAGKDIEATGDAIEDTAEKTKEKM